MSLNSPDAVTLLPRRDSVLNKVALIASQRQLRRNRVGKLNSKNKGYASRTRGLRATDPFAHGVTDTVQHVTIDAPVNPAAAYDSFAK